MTVLVQPNRFKPSTHNGVGRGVHNGVRKMGGGNPIPPDIKSLITATDGTLRTLAGPTALYSAAAGQVPDGSGGVQVSTVAPVHADGYYGGPAYTNLVPATSPSTWLGSAGWTDDALTVDGRVFGKIEKLEADASLTSRYIGASAQTSNVWVQSKVKRGNTDWIFFTTYADGDHGGWVNLATGVKGNTFGTPDVFDVVDLGGGVYQITVSKFGTSFTNVMSGIVYAAVDGNGSLSCTQGAYYYVADMFSCQGYLFPYIPPGESVVSTVGTTTGNGIGVPLTGSTSADALIECFKGVPDGVDRVTPVFDDVGTGWSYLTAPWTFSGGVATAQLGTVSSLYDTDGIQPLSLGDRFLLTYTRDNTDNLRLSGASSAFGIIYLESVVGTHQVELTVTNASGGLIFYNPSSTKQPKVSNVSLQKLSGATGTVSVLMKMGAGSGEPPAGGTNIINVSGIDVYDGLYFTDASLLMAYDRSNPSIGITSSWDRNEYHIKIVEYNGTKFRVGNQRYTEAGVAIDASPVWSHESLAGGATFDGSFDPLTFLRWFLNSTVPNWMRVMFVSNQAGLGDTEILRRIMKYGKF